MQRLTRELERSAGARADAGDIIAVGVSIGVDANALALDRVRAEVRNGTEADVDEVRDPDFIARGVNRFISQHGQAGGEQRRRGRRKTSANAQATQSSVLRRMLLPPALLRRAVAIVSIATTSSALLGCHHQSERARVNRQRRHALQACRRHSDDQACRAARAGGAERIGRA